MTARVYRPPGCPSLALALVLTHRAIRDPSVGLHSVKPAQATSVQSRAGTGLCPRHRSLQKLLAFSRSLVAGLGWASLILPFCLLHSFPSKRVRNDYTFGANNGHPGSPQKSRKFGKSGFSQPSILYPRRRVVLRPSGARRAPGGGVEQLHWCFKPRICRRLRKRSSGVGQRHSR